MDDQLNDGPPFPSELREWRASPPSTLMFPPDLVVDRTGAPCRRCGRRSEDLEWFWFESPAQTWEWLCGRAGWATWCTRCDGAGRVPAVHHGLTAQGTDPGSIVVFTAAA